MKLNNCVWRPPTLGVDVWGCNYFEISSERLARIQADFCEVKLNRNALKFSSSQQMHSVESLHLKQILSLRHFYVPLEKLQDSFCSRIALLLVVLQLTRAAAITVSGITTTAIVVCVAVTITVVAAGFVVRKYSQHFHFGFYHSGCVADNSHQQCWQPRWWRCLRRVCEYLEISTNAHTHIATQMG